MSSRNPSCVNMSYMADMPRYIIYDIAFHDLHMVYVIKELKPFRSYHFAECCTPWGLIALVILMAVTVEQFHYNCNAVFFGCWHELPQTNGAVDHPFVIVLAFPVA